MTLPDDKHRRNPRERFRNILSAEKEDGAAPEVRKPPVVNLPRASAEGQQQTSQTSSASGSPGSRSAQVGLPASRFMPTFWTMGGILSVIANVILVGMLISAKRGFAALNPAGAGSAALVGVYSNLELLGQAHIRTTIPIETTVALSASVPVQAVSNITLRSDVLIPGAHVTISTGPFNIDAPANVTLPAGTVLDAVFDMNLPMNTGLPVVADVPVDIAVNSTELQAAIAGLQDSLRPLVCAASPDAVLPDGRSICR